MHTVRRKAFLLLLFCLSGCGDSTPRRTPTGYNVVLISLDSTRRDMLSAYGREPAHAPGRPTTPHIDRLARQGVLFEHAYSTTSWTLPSHMSIFTGQPELVHAVELDPHRLSSKRASLPQILSRAGYRTAGFFSGPYLDPRYGFGRGFDTYEACYGPDLRDASGRAAQLTRQLDAGQFASREEAQVLEWQLAEARFQVENNSHRDVSSPSVTDRALAELELLAGSEKPFLLFAHYFDPHYDYVPPAPHDSAFDPDYPGTLDGVDFYRNRRISLFDESSNDHDRIRIAGDRDLEHIFSLYEGELEWTDLHVGRILDRLERLGLAERTLVIVTSDHGDEFFEHDGLGHRRTLYEEVLQVPLILRLPEALPRDLRIEGPVSTLSILPTTLELLGLAPPSDLTGPSLLPRIQDPTRPGDGVLGRFVGRTEFTAAGHVGAQYTVIESYLRDWIKVTRERKWMELPPEAPEALRNEIETRNETVLGETLRWIDLEQSPAERELDASRDFSDPRARAVLQEFHDRYRELSLLRDRAEALGEGADLSMLEGLGYGGGAAHGSTSSDALRLPPPGERLLRER